MYNRGWILLYGIICIGVIDAESSQPKNLDQSVNLALETVFEFEKDGKSDIQLLNNVQKFIGKVKDVLEQKHAGRRQAGPDQRNVFTNFILNTVNVLNKLEDNELQRFFGILNNEMQHYCDVKDDINILNKLGLFRNMPANVLRQYLKAITKKIEKEAYFEDEKAVIDGVNYLFKQDDSTKYDTFIHNLEEYRRKSRRSIDLVQVIKSGLRNIFLSSYYRIEPTAKTILRTILNHYFGNFLSLHHPVVQETNTVKRAQFKTTKEFRTWRQMYVEKNLDLKYPTYEDVPVTETNKRKHKNRTQKSRVMTLPTTRVTKESHHHKVTKRDKMSEYDINIDTSKHTDNSNEESNSDERTKIKTTENTDEEVFYKRGFDNENGKQLKSKENNVDEDKYKTESKNIDKLSTFYLDLDKTSATSNVQQRLNTPRTHERHERPIGGPIKYTFGIRYGKQRNYLEKSKKSKHFGYLQKKRLFANKRQMPNYNNDLKKERMPPMSLNMQFSVTTDPSTLDNDFWYTKSGAKNAYNPLSEEGLSIEGFHETKRIMYNRRSNNLNNTASNHVLNLIQKLEQDLQAVKTKIHNVSVLRNKNKLDNITENYDNRYNFSSSGKKAILESAEVNIIKPYDMGARKTIIDEKWDPVIRDREAASTEVIIERKYELFEKALMNQNKDDIKENFSKINTNIYIRNDSLTKNKVTYEPLLIKSKSSTTINFPFNNAKKIKIENTTIAQASSNTDNGTFLNHNSNEITLQSNSENETFDNNKSTVKTNHYINVKLTGDENKNNGNTKKSGAKQTILLEPNKIEDELKFKLQMSNFNDIENMTLKETITTKTDINKTSATNYKNTTDSAIEVIKFDATQKLTDVALNEMQFEKPTTKEIERQHNGINNNNVTMTPKLNKLKEKSATDSKTVNKVNNSVADKTSYTTTPQ